MRSLFRQRPFIIFSLIALIGILTILFIFPYYWLELGVKSCKGLPTDLPNCGDADFGGVGLFFAGLPLVTIGLVGMAYLAVRHYLSAKSQHRL